MPWNSAGASRHKKGLSPKQKKKWSDIANNVLKRTGNEVSAIKIANAKTKRSKKK